MGNIGKEPHRRIEEYAKKAWVLWNCGVGLGSKANLWGENIIIFVHLENDSFSWLFQGICSLKSNYSQFFLVLV